MKKLQLIAQAKLPTKYGEFTIVGFEQDLSGDKATANPLKCEKKEHVALIYGDITCPKNNELGVLCRLHSECLTGDALHSLRCDCGFQLEAAMEKITKEGCGVILYHRAEGRGIGLLNKIRAYALQDQGMDTYEANVALGFKPDERDFGVCGEMLDLLKVDKIRLLTNNPEKVKSMQEVGINIKAREPLEVGRNKFNDNYLDVKAKKMGHILSIKK